MEPRPFLCLLHNHPIPEPHHSPDAFLTHMPFFYVKSSLSPIVSTLDGLCNFSSCTLEVFLSSGRTRLKWEANIWKAGAVSQLGKKIKHKSLSLDESSKSSVQQESLGKQRVRMPMETDFHYDGGRSWKFQCQQEWNLWLSRKRVFSPGCCWLKDSRDLK